MSQPTASYAHLLLLQQPVFLFNPPCLVVLSLNMKHEIHTVTAVACLDVWCR
jgi:hypothetical protein